MTSCKYFPLDRRNFFIALLLLTSFISPVHAENKPSSNLQKQIQGLKDETLKLNRDLFILEEELLFPANTQFSIFVSMNKGEFFELDSVQIKIDGKNIANYLYTEREITALKRGGVQRIHIGNIASGKHELVAVFTGVGSNKRDFKRATTTEFDKSSDPLFIELQILDDQSKQQADFVSKVWE